MITRNIAPKFTFLILIITIFSHQVTQAHSLFVAANLGGAKIGADLADANQNKLDGLFDLSIGYNRTVNSKVALSFRNYFQDISFISEKSTILGQGGIKYQIGNRLFFLDGYYELYQDDYFGLFTNLGVGGCKTINKLNQPQSDMVKESIWRMALKFGLGIDYMFDAGFYGEVKYDYMKSVILVKIADKFVYQHGHTLTFGLRYDL